MSKQVVSRLATGAMAALMAVTLVAPFQKVEAEKDSYTGAYKDIQRVSVHDPSIVKDDKSGMYYVFGSHLATAKSEDLVNWTSISTDYQDADKNPVYGNVYKNFAESFQWAGYDDGDCSGGNLAVWAPDVTYDEDYIWKDGSKGAYLMYYSASSTWRRSCIGLAVSKTVEGPYEYSDTLIYSGITSNGATDGKSTRNTKWDNDYVNFSELIAKGTKDGGISGVNEKWFKKDGSYNTDYAPNAIDPTIIDGKDGKMYMVYGSWSGGLFILEVDKETGKVIYPGVDGTDATSGNYVDRYYGTHIAGGNHQSGEGPFIVYDKETDYYYMYETYGGLTRTGGYNMRLFRSKNIYGPYEDAAGNNAKNSGKDNYKYGIKLMGNYQFYDQRGYCAAGHNSALIDDDGNRYLFFHQRFNEGTEYHEVRVRQQFLNEDAWPVNAVYENRNEKIANYTDDEVACNYEFVKHGTAAADGTMIATEMITLNKDGSISGDETGTWKKTDSKAGYDYVTLSIGGATYKGVFYKQTKDTGAKAMTFTAIGNDNQCVWGSELQVSDKMMVDLVASKLMIPQTARENITLPTSMSGAKITYKSSNPLVLSNKGVVRSMLSDKKVTLTATIQYGTEKVTKKYDITVYAIPKLIYGYDFLCTKGQKVDASVLSSKKAPATLVGNAKIVKDKNWKRGRVLQITSEKGQKGKNYLSLPADTLKGVTSAGYTVNMWVNISSDTFEHSALFEADAKAAYPMTRIGANLIGRINANGYSDVICENTGKRDAWQMVTYTVSTSGIKVYLDGKLIGEEKKDLTSCFDASNAACIQNATDVMVGAGYIWNDEDVRNGKFDDIQVYNGVLTEKEIEVVYNCTK